MQERVNEKHIINDFVKPTHGQKKKSEEAEFAHRKSQGEKTKRTKQIYCLKMNKLF